MLTIEDIRNPKRKSGFDHVGRNERGGPDRNGRIPSWRAQLNGATGKGLGSRWKGPTRKLPEEAAQDYCDYINGQTKPLTIEDIRNPKRKSGFDHVNFKKRGARDGPGWKPYQAEWGTRSHAGTVPPGHGPRRATSSEAAQDYCDYINGQSQQTQTANLKSAGHKGKRDRLDDDAEIKAALGVLRDAKGQRKGKQGYVYLIAERGHDYGVKVGYSTNPEARVGELQTGNPRILHLLAKQKGTLTDEKALHSKYLRDNQVQEWFRPSAALFAEFGLDHTQWVKSFQGSIVEPEGIVV